MIRPPPAMLFRTVTRVLGIALAVCGVLFHRRGLMDWREPVYVLACVTLQEMFLVLPALRRFRPYLLAFYLMLPALFVLFTRDRIEPFQGDAIALALQTPLPLMLLPIQLMVLYTREASRLSSLVLVLTLFFVVAGLRRQVDDLIWPWMLIIGTLATLYMACSYPARIHLLMFPVFEGRSQAPPVASPGGLVRASYFGLTWLAVLTSLIVSVGLFFVMPRIKFSSAESDISSVAEQERRRAGGTPAGGTGPRESNPGGKRDLSTVSALSNKVELGDFGEIKKSHKPALEVTPLRVETPRQSGPPIYLRAFTYGEFDGEVWAPLSTAAQDSKTLPAMQAGKRKLPGARDANAQWRLSSYKVEVLDGGLGESGELPVVANPRALTLFDGQAAYDGRAGVVRTPALRKGGVYGFDSVELALDYTELEDKVAGVGPLRPPPDGTMPRDSFSPVRAYWLLPEPLMKQLGNLLVVQEIRERSSGRGVGSSPVAAARWLVRWFNGNTGTSGGPAFRYSLMHRPGSGEDCIYRFLTTEPYGHCEYFATAMCAILRAAGIPCRLAAGFHATKFNLERGLYEVEAANAHAWVELYVQQYGWIAFDPTPSSNVESEAEPTPLPETETPPNPPATPDDPKPEEPEENPKENRRDPLISFDSAAQSQLMDDLSDGIESSISQIEDSLAPLVSWMPGFLPESAAARVALLSVPLGICAAYWLWRRRKRRKLVKRVLDEMGLDPSLSGATKRQQSLYLNLLLTLARYGYHKRHFETPREFAWRVVRRGGVPFEPIRALTEAFYRVRFGVVSDQRQEEAVFKRLLVSFAERLRHDVVAAQSALPPAPGNGV